MLRFCLLLGLSFILGIIACSSSTEKGGRWKDRRDDELSKIERVSPPTEPPLAPWQSWNSRENFGVKEFAEADELVRFGKFADAVLKYQEVEQFGISPDVKREAFVRRVGTLLKTGASANVLQLIADDVAKNKIEQASIDPRLALIAAFAYYHSRDTDQALAWLGVSNANSKPGQFTHTAAPAAASAILASLSAADFESVRGRWSSDPFIAPLLTRESMARLNPAPRETPDLMAWFNPARYVTNGATPDLPPQDAIAQNSTLPQAAGQAGVVGVLLPLTGQYASHAEQVKQGIEFALTEVPGDMQIRLVYGDTKGDPAVAAAEYERLVSQEKAKVILGPLLYETSLSIAQKSLNVGTPFITFTKRAGVAGMSGATFRLGVTSESQAAELVSYAFNTSGLNTFAVISPNDTSSVELRDELTRAVSAAGGKLVSQASYEPGSADYNAVVGPIVAAKPQVVFLSATLENSWQVVQALKNMGLSALIMGPASWDDPVAIRGYGQVLEGAVFASAFYPFSVRGQVTSFVDGFRNSYGANPEVLSAQAYDAAKIAFSVADSPDSGSVIQRLHSVDNYNGVTGALSVASNGEIKRRMTILKIQNGQVVEVVSAGQSIGFVPNGETQTQQTAN